MRSEQVGSKCWGQVGLSDISQQWQHQHPIDLCRQQYLRKFWKQWTLDSQFSLPPTSLLTIDLFQPYFRMLPVLLCGANCFELLVWVRRGSFTEAWTWSLRGRPASSADCKQQNTRLSQKEERYSLQFIHPKKRRQKRPHQASLASLMH